MFITVIAVCLVAFAGCNNTNKTDKFGEKLEKNRNFEMEVTMVVPFLGTLAYTVKADGNKTYNSEFMGSEEEYTETIGDTVYTYKKSEDGVWTKDEGEKIVEDEESTTESEDVIELFKGDNYEYSKDKKGYVMKSDVNTDVMGGMKSVVIVFNDNGCTITGDLVENGIQVAVTMKITNVGKTKVELPEVK